MYSVVAVKDAISFIYYALLVYETVIFLTGLAKYALDEYTGGDVLFDAFWLILSANLLTLIKFIFF